MQQPSTPDHLVQFLYRETSPQEGRKLRRRLREDPQLQEAYRQLAQAKRMLPNVRFGPSRRVRDRILSYSRRAMISRGV